MTWYAGEIILQGTPRALGVVGASNQLAPFAYHVRSFAHDWYRREFEHGLPPDGLLVIRPVCGRSSYGREWHGMPTLDWSSIGSESENESMLDEAASRCLSEY